MTVHEGKCFGFSAQIAIRSLLGQQELQSFANMISMFPFQMSLAGSQKCQERKAGYRGIRASAGIFSVLTEDMVLLASAMLIGTRPAPDSLLKL